MRYRAPLRFEVTRFTATEYVVLKQKGPPLCETTLLFVGVTGFEPATPCTPCKCATGLRYTPKILVPQFTATLPPPKAGCATGLRYTPNEGANVTEAG
jgi:hypothetical protein